MDLAWSAEDAAFRSELRCFLDEHTPPELGTHDPDAELLPDWARRWQATLFDHGWMVPAYAPELGGRNATLRQSVVYVEELAAREVPRSLHFAGYAIVAPTLLQFGTPAQRALAPAALRGDNVWCVGMSEPDAGSDLASLATRAEADDDHFVVTGRKTWTSYSPVADFCLAYVRTGPLAPKHAGISALIIDMRSPGVSVSPVRHLGGTAEFAEVSFDHVVVPRAALVGELDGGWAVINGSLGHERSVMWLESVARLEHVLHDLVALAGPNADRGMRREVATAYEQVSSLRALGFRSLGEPTLALHMKVATSELYSDLLELGTRILGAYGSVVDSPPTTPRRIWILDFIRGFGGTIAGGTSEIQRDIIARHALHLPRR